MPAPRATDAPTREGVTVHRTEGVTLPAKRKSWSWAGYTARWNNDPMIVWERTEHAIVRQRVAGPVQAAMVIRWAREKGHPFVVVWESDAATDPAADWGGHPHDCLPPEFRNRPVVSLSTIAEVRALEERRAAERA